MSLSLLSSSSGRHHPTVPMLQPPDNGVPRIIHSPLWLRLQRLLFAGWWSPPRRHSQGVGRGGKTEGHIRLAVDGGVGGGHYVKIVVVSGSLLVVWQCGATATSTFGIGE